MRELSLEKMRATEGGQVESCYDFIEVLEYLDNAGHNEQFQIILETYWDQYCGL